MIFVPEEEILQTKKIYSLLSYSDLKKVISTSSTKKIIEKNNIKIGKKI